jgi:hypothetical protein
VFNNLVSSAIEAMDQGTVRIDVAGHTREHKLDLKITVRHRSRGLSATSREALHPFATVLSANSAERIEPPIVADAIPPRLTAATQLARFIGGDLKIEDATGGAKQATLTLPISIDTAASEIILDLAGRPALVVSEDSRFAGDLAELLTAWRADIRWLGGCDAAPAYLDRVNIGRATVDRAGGERPVLIVDGRTQLLPALSFAHHAASSDGEPPFILFVAEESQIEGIAELAAGAFDSLLAAPLNDDLLGSALHALPLLSSEAMPPRRTKEAAPPEPASVPAAPPPTPILAERVTPIAAHPRFAPEAAGILDTAAIETLRRLGADDGFFYEVLDSFRSEANQIFDRIKRAAADGDVAAFSGALNALRRGAITVGGTRLAELLLSLTRIGVDDLRDQGSAYAQRIGAELSRLETALLDFAGASEPQQQL